MDWRERRGLAVKQIRLPDYPDPITIRRIHGEEFMRLGALPVINRTAYQERLIARELTPEDEDFTGRYNLFLLERGVVDPPLWCGDWAETPDDRLHLSAWTAADKTAAIAAIVEFSSFGQGGADEVEFPGGTAGAGS